MKLSDFERSGDKGYPRFVTQVQDVSGEERFELTIAGPEALVEEVFADATIELTKRSSAASIETAPDRARTRAWARLLNVPCDRRSQSHES